MGSERWLRLLSQQRLGEPPDRPGGDRRTAFQRDYDRIVFSNAFRRLSGKTQVFPLPNSDAIHSRLTHSLEVSSVGRSLGSMTGEMLLQKHPELAQAGLTERSIGDIVAAACIAHDIGNPPFGHAGEDAIGRWFRSHPEVTALLRTAERADLEAFEGNAQGFRILTRLQIPKNPGLRLTLATLAAYMKYPRPAGLDPRPRGASAKKHGYFQCEAEFFEEVATRVELVPHDPAAAPQAGWKRHPLAFLVEAADDICYSILDIEDGFSLGLVPYSQIDESVGLIARKSRSFTVPSATTNRAEQEENVAYMRAKAINVLVTEVRNTFVELEDQIVDGTFDEPLKKHLPSRAELKTIVEVSRRTCYQERSVLEIELAGYEVLSFLLDEFVPAALSGAGEDSKFEKIVALLPHPIPDGASTYDRLLAVTDYLSGMTDSFAVQLFRRLRGINLPTRI